MALTNKLSAIGDAIREKTGKTELLTLDAMPLEIASIETGGGGGGIEVEPIVISGICQRICAGPMASQYIKLFGNTVSTANIDDAQYMFYQNTVETIPFDINIRNGASSCQLGSMFRECFNLKELPRIRGNGKIYNCGNMFDCCYSLREIPNDYFDGLNISHWPTATSAYSHQASYMFDYCYSLRQLPLHWFKNMNPMAHNSYSYFSYGFNDCQSLDELIGLPIPYTKATWTSNAFSSAFTGCARLKNITFEKDEDSSPIVVQWKSQTIDLSVFVGRAGASHFITNFNSGITKDKEVKDDATYQALKNDPDWYTANIDYSRYNHDSAVNTINSLPDTSAYLATAGGTNTIKFNGAAGAKTDGGAINTLTAEEIAVATAKGWTVSFT